MASTGKEEASPKSPEIVSDSGVEPQPQPDTQLAQGR